MFLEELFIKAPNWKLPINSNQKLPSGRRMDNNCGAIVNKLQLCNNMTGSHIHNIEQKKRNTEQKKLDSKVYVLYNFIYVSLKIGKT